MNTKEVAAVLDARKVLYEIREGNHRWWPEEYVKKSIAHVIGQLEDIIQESGPLFETGYQINPELEPARIKGKTATMARVQKFSCTAQFAEIAPQQIIERGLMSLWESHVVKMRDLVWEYIKTIPDGIERRVVVRADVIIGDWSDRGRNTVSWRTFNTPEAPKRPTKRR